MRRAWRGHGHARGAEGRAGPAFCSTESAMGRQQPRLPQRLGESRGSPCRQRCPAGEPRDRRGHGAMQEWRRVTGTSLAALPPSRLSRHEPPAPFAGEAFWAGRRPVAVARPRRRCRGNVARAPSVSRDQGRPRNHAPLRPPSWKLRQDGGAAGLKLRPRRLTHGAVASPRSRRPEPGSASCRSRACEAGGSARARPNPAESAEPSAAEPAGRRWRRRRSCRGSTRSWPRSTPRYRAPAPVPAGPAAPAPLGAAALLSAVARSAGAEAGGAGLQVPRERGRMASCAGRAGVPTPGSAVPGE